MIEEHWVQFARENKPEQAADAYPRSLEGIKRLWLPPADIIALAEEAERSGCLSEAGRLWLRRVRTADNGGRL